MPYLLVSYQYWEISPVGHHWYVHMLVCAVCSACVDVRTMQLGRWQQAVCGQCEDSDEGVGREQLLPAGDVSLGAGTGHYQSWLCVMLGILIAISSLSLSHTHTSCRSLLC